MEVGQYFVKLWENGNFQEPHENGNATYIP